jgi:iron(III) transport system ATP-binding protein
MSDQPVLKVENVGHAYGRTPVLQGVSFDLYPGELLAVLGASGSGKSTLLRALAGFVCATGGRVVLEGRLLSECGNEHVPAEQRGVGLVFQDYALFPHMTVADNVAYGIHRSPDKAKRVAELLGLVGLEELGPRLPTSLSGGQKQRVALARALAPRPKVLLLDEPFANLDGPIRMEVGHAVRSILRQAGAAGILVTHDHKEAMALADRVAVLGPRAHASSEEPSELLQIDTPVRLYEQPASRVVAELTGFVLSLTGDGQGGTVDTVFGSIALWEEHLGPIEVLVRRHQLSFEVEAAGTVEVVDGRYVGPGYQLCLETKAGECWVDHALNLPLGTRGIMRLRGPCMAVKQAI